jgi:methionyl-tRNA formyltransferase
VKHAALPVVLGETEVLSAEDAGVAPGEVVAAGPEGIDVACQPGTLRVLSLRPAGGRTLAARDFLNARRIVAGDRFVAPPAVS